MEGQTGWRGKRDRRLQTASLEIKAMENAHEWGSSHRRQCCWAASSGGYCCVCEVSPAWRSPESDSKGSIFDTRLSRICWNRQTVRAYFSFQDMWKQAGFHHAQIVVRYANLKCVFGKGCLLMKRLWFIYKMINNFLIWRHLNKFLYWLWLKHEHAKVINVLNEGRVDKVIKWCRLILP